MFTHPMKSTVYWKKISEVEEKKKKKEIDLVGSCVADWLLEYRPLLFNIEPTWMTKWA